VLPGGGCPDAGPVTSELFRRVPPCPPLLALCARGWTVDPRTPAGSAPPCQADTQHQQQHERLPAWLESGGNTVGGISGKQHLTSMLYRQAYCPCACMQLLQANCLCCLESWPTLDAPARTCDPGRP
jgi:hypothetical protein